MIIWVIFAVDYLIRLALAQNRGQYARRHIVDLLVIALPVLRPLRLLRVVMLLRIMNRRAVNSLRGRVLVYVVGATLLVTFCAGLAVLDAERRSGDANITTFGDALWWAATTVTTVGYGDRYPVTVEGRFVAIGLMITGIALLGVVTASIAAWLIARVEEMEASTQDQLSRELAELRSEISSLRLQLQTGAAHSAPRTSVQSAAVQS